MRSAFAWSLSSTPSKKDIKFPTDYVFNGDSDDEDLRYGFKRAKMAWYTIDPIFYTQKPSGITDKDLSLVLLIDIFFLHS